ncbi:MAG TPA: glycosyltransferase family 4 protein [Xanthobacteraceae bacterium]|nr:glycosyltransferase family 4 protein [Xanthobacteraceae bacterium]
MTSEGEMPAGTRSGPARLLYVVTEDWYFLSHRLPMARAARSAGFEVHVAANVKDGAKAILDEGFVLHPVPFARGRLSPRAALATIRALRRVHRAVSPAIVHHVALQPTVFGLLAAIGQPAASVNAVTGLGHTFIADTLKARLVRRAIGLVLRTLLNRGRSVALVQNPDDRDLLDALGIAPQRIALIPGSGVDVERLRPVPEPDGPVTVGFVGRLLDDKGIHVLVAAHRMLRTKGLPLNLLIAGTPDAANPASISAEEATGWAREPGITWLGHVSDITTVWAHAHVAVLPSRREGLPKSLLEAAACGRPMVATDVPGCREITIDGKTGLLVPPDDPVALAGAIEHLAASPELRARYGAAARRLAVEWFSAEAIGRATVALYTRLAMAGDAVDPRGGAALSSSGSGTQGSRTI